MTSSQIQDGGRPLIWKSFCRHRPVSEKNYSITTKFGKPNQLTVMKMIWPKFKFLDSKWRTDVML